MKTNESINVHKTLKKQCYQFIITLCIFMCCGCSKSDDVAVSPINAKTQTFELNGINNCNTSSGSGSTLLMYVPYAAPAGTMIEKLHVKTTVSSGESDTKTTTVFKDENNVVEWATCMRYGSQTWVEFEVRLEDAAGNMSNPTIIKINKPSGAN